MQERELSIRITTGTVGKIIIMLALAWLVYLLRDLVILVLTSIVIASAVEPGAVGLVKRGIPRTLAVIIVYLIVFSVFFAIIFFFLPSVLGDLASFVA
ncbi:MAG TPA: hypothetical protein VN495_03935, partial [Candidatus Paceibacterota bacterium]|nr:hypothetical protein [Candidatus Paceibacterota bacterium]